MKPSFCHACRHAANVTRCSAGFPSGGVMVDPVVHDVMGDRGRDDWGGGWDGGGGHETKAAAMPG